MQVDDSPMRQQLRRFERWVKAHTQASQGVDTVNVHGAGTADTLTAGSTESESWVKLVLDANKSIQHHGTGFVQVELIRLHGGLLGRGVRVPAVDLEGLHLGGLGDIAVDGRIGASEAGWAEQRPRRSEESRSGAEGSHDGRMEDYGKASSTRRELFRVELLSIYASKRRRGDRSGDQKTGRADMRLEVTM